MSTLREAIDILADKLKTATWPSGATELIFADHGVVVSTEDNDLTLQAVTVPAAVIRPTSAQSDPVHNEEPDLIHQVIVVRLIVSVAGDPVGEHALLGANDAGDVGTSQGRGLHEVEQRLFATISFLNVKDLLTIQHRASSADADTVDSRLGHIAYRDYSFETIVTAF